MKKLLTLLLIIGFCINSNAQYKGTFGSYYQKEDYKWAKLTGYGTDNEAGFEAPILHFIKEDNASAYIYLNDCFMFSYHTEKAYALTIKPKDENKYQNLEVYFIFKNDKKNKKWKLSNFDLGGKTEKYSNELLENYSALFIFEIENVDTKERLSTLEIIDKLKESKEVIISIQDDNWKNICRFQVRKHKNKIKKVLSDKYKSIQEELLN